jgi:hypothetical protein
MRTNDVGRRMDYEIEIAEPLRGDGGQGRERKRVGVCGVIRVKPGALDARRISKLGHVLRVLKTLDEIRKVPAVFEQQRRCGRRLPNVEARHGAEEFVSCNAPNRQIDCRESVNQADGHVIAIHVVALDRPLASGADDQ